MSRPSTAQLQARAVKDGELELTLYGIIGDTWDGSGITARQVSEALKNAGQIEQITVRINSAGGDVFQGEAIYNLLRNDPARVHVVVDGSALSIASLIAMAGDVIEMAENALLMIHDPSSFTWGTAADMRKQADLLDKAKSGLVATYAARTGQEPAAIADWMTLETWFTAAEALEAGFATQIGEAKRMAACGDPERFKNLPEWARSRFAHCSGEPPINSITKDELMPQEKPAGETPAPQNVAQNQPAGGTPAPQEKPAGGTPAPQAATLAELKAGMPSADAAFVLECLEKGLTLPAAQTAWIAHLEKEVNDLKASKPAGGVAPVKTSPQPAAGTPVSGGTFNDLITARMEETGEDYATARKTVARSRPELYSEWVQSIRTTKNRD